MILFIEEEFPKPAAEVLLKDGAVPLQALRGITAEGRALCVLVSRDPTMDGGFETHMSVSVYNGQEPRPQEIYEAAAKVGLAKPKQWTIINKIAHVYE